MKDTRAKIMGILNMTPDSFSDGGKFLDLGKAIEHGLKMIADGAHILDIGGESTRPGATPVSAEEQIKRVVPAIEALKGQGTLISIDTRDANVMEAALEAGARMINDVSALNHDPRSMDFAAAAKVPAVLMHMQGTPQTMQDNPVYKDIVEDVFEYLKARIQACIEAGIDKSLLIADPGFGFGKTAEHNRDLLRNLERFQALGVPLMVGLSRKSFLGKDLLPQERLAASLDAALHARLQGARIFRVHDVAETVMALKAFDVLAKS
ncbi:MAG: dihydropteroate synthase [Alphaproteobacteria bacterium]